MNYLGIDFGTKRIGLAYSVNGIISPLKVLANDQNLFTSLRRIIDEYHIEKIYIGLSEGHVAELTQKFAAKLTRMLELPVETVDEAVSTLEADSIYQVNGHQSKDYKKNIDSVAAAVILRRVIN